MKKLTLLKLVLVVTAAMSLYGQSIPISTTLEACPSFCFHLTCGNGVHAHCSGGQCVCP
jgi:hypothetical protein